jgi:hypothetical protein
MGMERTIAVNDDNSRGVRFFVEAIKKVQGTRYKGQGTRKAQGSRHKGQVSRNKIGEEFILF